MNGTAETMPPPAPPVMVLYGSQTGHASDVSYFIARRLCDEGFANTTVGSLDAFGFDALQRCHLALLVVSTTGQGDAPDNMASVWRQLMRRACPRLPHLRFSVLCLGDSSYEKYNYIGKMLHNRLGPSQRGLGGQPLCDKGLCDDQDPNGLDDALHPWLDSVVSALQALPASEALRKPDTAAVPTGQAAAASPLRYTVRQLAAAETNRPNGGNPPSSADAGGAPAGSGEGVEEEGEEPATHPSRIPPQRAAAPHLVVAEVVENTRMTPEAHWQEVRHIGFSLGDVASAHQHALEALVPGCSVGVLPVNPEGSVHFLLSRLGLGGEEVVSIGVNPSTGISFLGDFFGGKEVAVSTLLREWLDIEGIPTRRALGVLAGRCPEGSEERQKLEELCSSTPQGMEDFRFYCSREKRTYVEVVKDFPSASVDLAVLMEIVPPLQSRLYSISSSGGEHPSICVAAVRYDTPYGRKKRGLCSTYLSGLPVGAKIVLSIHEPTAVFPDPESPLVLIGPGTGVAPCRSVLRSLHSDAEARASAHGKVTLIFGCRNRENDFLYGSEMLELAGGVAVGEGGGGGSWLRLGVAFSRDQGEKQYVQHVIRQQEALSSAVAEALAEGGDGVVFISGSAKDMPKSVQLAVVWSLMKHMGLEEGEAAEYLQRMKKTRRVQFDTWN